MLLENKIVAIIGGGPGGLTLARLLQLKGVDVKVYERDFDRTARVQGSPLDMHEESGTAALRKAGLMDAFRENFRPGADKKLIVDEKAEVHYSDHSSNIEDNFGHQDFRPEIDRGPLRAILLDSLQPETVVWDSHFISMKPQNEGWLLHFKNGKTAYADLAIASDGANSKVRPYLTDIKPIYSGVTMLEGNIQNSKVTAPHFDIMLDGGKIMAFGESKCILGGQKGDGDLGYYASFKTEEHWAVNSGIDFDNKAEVLAWFQKEYAVWDVSWIELFENATTPFIPRPIYFMPLDEPWETVSNLTLLGDAAHVMPPFAGEGANMAMLDALELSECLTSDQFDNLKNTMSDYETKLRIRASKAIADSLENGERMHAENALTDMLDFFKGH